VARHPAGTLYRRYRWNALSIGESGPLIVREVAIERAIADAGMHRVIVGVDVQNDDPLELGQGEASELRRLNIASFVDVAERGAAPLVHPPHHGADQPLDRAVVLRVPFGADLRADAMQSKPALDAFRFVFRSLIVFENGRLAPDRPMHVGQVALHQPILLGQARMSQASRDGEGRCALQQHREAENGTAVEIDGERDVRASNDRAVLLANEPDITGLAVDLHPLPRRRVSRSRSCDEPAP